jgi:hypothetical protein
LDNTNKYSSSTFTYNYKFLFSSSEDHSRHIKQTSEIPEKGTKSPKEDKVIGKKVDIRIRELLEL